MFYFTNNKILQESPSKQGLQAIVGKIKPLTVETL